MRTRLTLCCIIILCLAYYQLIDSDNPITIKVVGQLEAKEITKPLPILHNDNNLTATTSTIEPTLNQQQKDYCNLKKLNTDIPLDGNVKIFSGAHGPTEDIATYYWIYSPDCPENFYSIIHLGYDGEVKKKIHCQHTNLTELTQNSGMQWTIKDQIKKPGEFNFAISGPGSFLVYCPNDGFYLNRYGKFYEYQGLLADENGCFAFNTKQQPIVLSDNDQTLDDEGCFKESGQCVALLHHSDSIVENPEYINSTLLAIELGEDDSKKLPRSFIYDNALEDLKNPQRGITGIHDWKYIDSFTKPDNCP